jgi:acyl carrier protein
MIEKKIHDSLKKIFKSEKIPKDIKKLKFGSFKSWDSLAHLNLLLLIEKEFKIKFPLNEMFEIRSVKQIIFIVQKKKYTLK